MAKALYHGSVTCVERVDLSLASPKRDFGAGFYTTSSKEQAARSFALSLLLPQKLTDQWVFRTSKAAERLLFLGAEGYGL